MLPVVFLSGVVVKDLRQAFLASVGTILSVPEMYVLSEYKKLFIAWIAFYGAHLMVDMINRH